MSRVIMKARGFSEGNPKAEIERLGVTPGAQHALSINKRVHQCSLIEDAPILALNRYDLLYQLQICIPC